jgi:hypothetical protein
MLSRKQFSAVVGVSLFVFQLSTLACQAADRNRASDTGQPHDLINQPACWSPEDGVDSRYCDFAQRT